MAVIFPNTELLPFPAGVPPPAPTVAVIDEPVATFKMPVNKPPPPPAPFEPPPPPATTKYSTHDVFCVPLQAFCLIAWFCCLSVNNPVGISIP
jgi:hypothetical protein